MVKRLRFLGYRLSHQWRLVCHERHISVKDSTGCVSGFCSDELSLESSEGIVIKKARHFM